MADEITYFSTDDADKMFLNVFVLNATSTIESGAHEKAASLYKDLGESWYDVEQALAVMTSEEGAHVPAEGSTLKEDCKFAVEHSLGLLWEVLKPTLRVRKVPLNLPAIAVVYEKCAIAAAALNPKPALCGP